MNDFCVFKKRVDKSLLFQGFTIPQMFHGVFYNKIGFRLKQGESRIVSVSLCGINYNVKVTNQRFDRNRYANHGEILQIRYDNNKELIEKLRQLFFSSWNNLQSYYANNHEYKGFKNELDEYLTLYAVDGTLLIECVPLDEYNDVKIFVPKMNEYSFETDENAYIESKMAIKKIRHLSTAVGNSLKVIYGYRCQICGQYIGERYGTNLIHAHHIEYFTRSLNNNPTNIMIVCPNHHGIIHSCNPRFNSSTKQYEYENGYKEGLLLNVHI